MSRRIALGGLGIALATAMVTWWYVSNAAGWGTLGASTRLASLGADVFFLNVPEIVRRGPPRVVVVRLEQAAALVPYHYADRQLPGPQTVEDWAQHLKAPVVFNAGQFDEKLQYLGWLKSEGRWLVERRKTAWMGLLVSGPIDGSVWGRIVDLEQSDGAAMAARYQNVMQSMMLVDEGARIRVRRSDLAACRTVVAEDKRGRLLIIATEGAITLYDMARWLPNSGLGIVRAMNLDGGIESQLAINTPELSLTLYGQYGTESSVFEVRGQMVRYPLPAVVAVRPLSVSEE